MWGEFSLKTLTHLHTERTRRKTCRILADGSHPLSNQPELLKSGRQQSLSGKSVFKQSFIPNAGGILNSTMVKFHKCSTTVHLTIFYLVLLYPILSLLCPIVSIMCVYVIFLDFCLSSLWGGCRQFFTLVDNKDCPPFFLILFILFDYSFLLFKDHSQQNSCFIHISTICIKSAKRSSDRLCVCPERFCSYFSRRGEIFKVNSEAKP